MSAADRRAHPRFAFQARLLFNLNGYEYQGNCQDLGRGGLGFMAGLDIPVGSTLTLYLVLPEESTSTRLEVVGTVRWRLPVANVGLYRYGVTFKLTDPATRRALAMFLSHGK